MKISWSSEAEILFDETVNPLVIVSSKRVTAGRFSLVLRAFAVVLIELRRVAGEPEGAVKLFDVNHTCLGLKGSDELSTEIATEPGALKVTRPFLSTVAIEVFAEE